MNGLKSVEMVHTLTGNFVIRMHTLDILCICSFRARKPAAAASQSLDEVIRNFHYMPHLHTIDLILLQTHIFFTLIM